MDYDELERDWDEAYEPEYGYDEDEWDEAAADFEDSQEEIDDGQPDEAQEWHDFDPDC